MTRYKATSEGIVPFTPEEEAQADLDAVHIAAYKAQRKIDAARAERNSLLAMTDWTQAADVPQATKDKWAPYRQALRDVPQQPGFPDNIQWPAKPE